VSLRQLPSELTAPEWRNLLTTGQQLLATTELQQLSVGAVVTKSGAPKSVFYRHWPSRHAYLLALHRSFHEQLAGCMHTAMDGLIPGRSRLSAGMHAYLDVCLTHPATRALLSEARTDALLGPQVCARNKDLARTISTDVDALGWQPVPPIATLLAAMIVETALQELALGERRIELRTATVRLAAPHHPADCLS
jgi:AcrR family transcriptional regulator